MLAITLFALGAFAASVAQGINPARFKKHSYTLPEMCTKEVRSMVYHDQVIVQTHEDQAHYETNVSCSLNFTMTPPGVGLIIAFSFVDTVDCHDYLQIAAPSMDAQKHCGPRSNKHQPIPAMIVENGSFPVQVDWEVAKHPEKTLPGGFQIVLTPFKQQCGESEICYPCANGYFVHPSAVCNGFDNCGDMSDESECPVPPPEPKSGHGWLIVLILLLCAAVFAASSIGLYAFMVRRQRDELRVRLDERSPLYLNQEEHS